MSFDSFIYKIQDKAFDYIIYVTWFLYLIILLGLSTNAPEYLDTLHAFIKIYVSLFLIIRFNPLRHIKFTELDAKISFSAGVFLLTTTAINNFIQYYLKNITESVQHKIKEIKTYI
jgi:hypothetical protein